MLTYSVSFLRRGIRDVKACTSLSISLDSRMEAPGGSGALRAGRDGPEMVESLSSAGDTALPTNGSEATACNPAMGVGRPFSSGVCMPVEVSSADSFSLDGVEVSIKDVRSSSAVLLSFSSTSETVIEAMLRSMGFDTSGLKRRAR